jgi:predicted N-formylglutamate amidohydrolase
MLQSVKTGPSILSADDPNPTEVVNASGKSAFVLTCEHAGRAIPSRLGDLGIDAAKFERHITKDRLCLVGALFNKDRTLADLFLRAFAAANPSIRVAENEPYRVDNMSDYTIPIHGEARGIPHLLLEIRNDQIGQAGDQARWARLLADALMAAAAMIHEKGAIDVR